MNIDQLLSEVHSDFKAYSEANLIDNITLRRHVINDLKRFGGNIMDVDNTVLEVRNGKTKLPENFWSLYHAIKCSPTGCEIEGGEEDVLIDSAFYRIRKEAQVEFDNESHYVQEGAYTEVTEKVYLHRTNTSATFKYGNFQNLRLRKGFKKQDCTSNCKNIGIKDSPFEIYINQGFIQTNFSKGFITMWYQGLEVEEETGEILIPEDQRIYDYIMYSAKHKVLENIFGNQDDDVQQKMQYFLQMKQTSFTSAMTAAKFSSVTGRDWWKGLKNQAKKRTQLFENYGYGK